MHSIQSGQSAQRDRDDPPYRPDASIGAAARGSSKAREKPYGWIAGMSPGKTNALLNFVGYDGGQLRSDAEGRSVLMNTALPYRNRLQKAKYKARQPNFEHFVRNCPCWRWEPRCDKTYHTHFPYNSAPTVVAPTSAPTTVSCGGRRTMSTERRPSRAALLAARADAADAADATDAAPVVPIGTLIPPRPILPANPGAPPNKPHGSLYPVSHDFTEKALDDFCRNNPDVSLIQMINNRSRIPGQNPDEQTYSAMTTCCWIVTPLKPAESQKAWCDKLTKEVYWRGGCIHNHDSLTQVGQINIIKHARMHGVDVFTSRTAPRAYASHEDVCSFLTLKSKHLSDVKAYDRAAVDLKAWNDKYGAQASVAVDDEDCVMVTKIGQEGDAKRERNQKLLAAAVCIDCTNPDCGCTAFATPAQTSNAE